MRLETTKTEVDGSSGSFLNPFDDQGLYADKHTGIFVKEHSPEYFLYMKEFFQREPCIYNHSTFQFAARIYESLRTDATKDAMNVLMGQPQREVLSIEFRNEHEKRLTYSLVFQTLKYQKFLNDMLDDCRFFQRYPEFKEDYSQVMVILCDFKERKFQIRQPPEPKETSIPSLSQIEDALNTCKTKLNAALARSRIKARVLSIDHLLPDSVRQNDKIGSNMHMYCWVNQIKTTMEDVLDKLVSYGFTRVDSEAQLSGRTYYLDHQCSDMVCFAFEEREHLEKHDLIGEGHLVIQDKSSCVGPHSIRSLINEGDDILFVNADAGLSIAHLISLTNNSDSIIFCFGVKSEKHYEQIIANLERLGVNSRVKLYIEDFMNVDPFDDRLKHIKCVLLVAGCSRSGVANPVNFIVSEGEDINILRDLSLGYTDENKLGELVVRHNSLLKHTLKFPRVQAVVYCTRSLLEVENESVVTRSIEFINMALQKKTPFRIAPPVLPLSDKDIESENPLNGKYLRYPPSPFMSGCFVATITREADDPKEAAKDILARAAARGILNVSQTKGEKVSKKRKGKGKKSKEAEITEEGEAAAEGGEEAPKRNEGVSVRADLDRQRITSSRNVSQANHMTTQQEIVHANQAYIRPSHKSLHADHPDIVPQETKIHAHLNGITPLHKIVHPDHRMTQLHQSKHHDNVASPRSTDLTRMASPQHQVAAKSDKSHKSHIKTRSPVRARKRKVTVRAPTLLSARRSEESVKQKNVPPVYQAVVHHPKPFRTKQKKQKDELDSHLCLMTQLPLGSIQQPGLSELMDYAIPMTS